MQAQPDRRAHSFHSTTTGDVLTSVVTEAAESCRQRGLNMTPIRRRVLAVVAASPTPVSAYTIIHRLSEAKLLGPPTVYRALEFLVAAGFVRHLALRKAYVRCKWPGQPLVALLICSTCGDTDELASRPMRDAISQFATMTGFVPHGHAIEIEGCCADCQMATNGDGSVTPL